MKIIKTAYGRKLKISKTEWNRIGQKAGWIEEEINDDIPPSSPYLTTIELYGDEGPFEAKILAYFDVKPTEYEDGHLFYQGEIKITEIKTAQDIVIHNNKIPSGSDIKSIISYWSLYEQGVNNLDRLSQLIANELEEKNTIPKRYYKGVR